MSSNVGMVIQAFKSVQLKCSVFVGSSVGTQTVIQASVSEQFNCITTYLFYLKCIFFCFTYNFKNYDNAALVDLVLCNTKL